MMKLMVHWTRALAFAALLFAGACATAPSPAGAPPAAPLACREVEGLEPLLAPGAGLLLGEIHGTAESPAFLANVACLALRGGHPVTVALEIPREEQARVDTFLGSAGSEADRAALLDSSFWTDKYQDGRRSRAMLSLLEDLRRLHHGGRPVRVALIDRLAKPVKWDERDRWMAEALAQAFEETPGGVVLSLTGNVHSRISPGTPWDADYQPAGYVLATMRPDLRVTALDASYPDGTAWTCTSAEASSCEARPLQGSGDGQGDRVVLLPEVTNGHNGTYQLSALTASPPAMP
jgi:hypothetical protein